MFLAPAVVVFVGIAGRHPTAIQHQLAPVLARAHVTTRAVSASDLGNLARHTDASRELVQRMHVAGVVGGALIESGGTLTLRVVIYDGTGHLESLGETPLGGRALSKDELDVLAENLDDELASLTARHPAEPEIARAAVEPPPKPAPTKVPTTLPPPAPTPPSSDLAEISFDSEAPPTEAHAAELHTAAPTQTADAVSLDDVAALNAAGTDTDTAPGTAAPAADNLHLHANAGLGLAGRSFSGPATLAGYSSSPVGTVHVEAGLAPTAHLALTAMAERALAMSSPVGSAMASTSMSRWEVTAAYTVTRGAVAIAPTLGVGQRSFAIDSTDPQRSPDTSYGYVVLGAAASMPIGQRLVVRGLAAFEPVEGGDDPTAMTFGAATRWALDVGAGVDLRVVPHVIARAAVDYQRFAWAWDAAGTRGAGGAVDSYPTGTLSVGAEY